MNQLAQQRDWRGILGRLFKRYFIDAMGAMAFGLFASLLIGIIMQQLFQLIDWEPLQNFSDLITAQTAATSPVVGAAIGVAIATGLKAKPLVLYGSAVVGAIGYSMTSNGVSAGPVGTFVAVIVAVEVAGLIAGRTKLDIILVPFVTLVSGTFAAMLIGPAMAQFMRLLGNMINEFTELQPFIMGILVSTVMGFVLFSPLSSAALSIMLGLNGLAAGAATAGCAASMIGFAACSWRENGLGGGVAQGLGTSMLQIGNVMRHPIILVPSTLAGAILGPVATVVFKMENIAYGSGMGTSGLVGPITTWTTMVGNRQPVLLLIQILLLHFVLPAAVSLAISEVMRKKGWIQHGWMSLPNT